MHERNDLWPDGYVGCALFRDKSHMARVLARPLARAEIASADTYAEKSGVGHGRSASPSPAIGRETGTKYVSISTRTLQQHAHTSLFLI